jgi:flagellin
MAINDVSLTAGMRSNLLSLQNTVDLLNRTQNRLSSGKKVNSAIDNPVSFFAAQALTSRASDIDSMKDAMGQAVQTIAAADKGLTAITAMIEQAKGLAQSGLTADNTQDTLSGTAAALAAGNTIILGGVTLTATANGLTPLAGEFNLGTTDEETAANLAAAINGATYAATNSYTASADGANLTITKYTVTTGMEADAVAGDITGTGAAGLTLVASDAPESELESLQAQYNTLRDQLSALAGDSGYKGKNLLGDDTLTVKFEGTTLDVVGFDASSTGLGITAATWVTGGSIDADVDLLGAAAASLRQQSSKMSGNLSIITVRQDFSTKMINTLTEGSDKLTLADTNEEGANMLMLQTRQSLSTTALSMSAQAAQSVLRLFQ